MELQVGFYLHKTKMKANSLVRLFLGKWYVIYYYIARARWHKTVSTRNVVLLCPYIDTIVIHKIRDPSDVSQGMPHY